MRKLLALVVLLVAACDKPSSAPPQKGDAESQAVMTALDQRFAVITDFTLNGIAEQGGEKLPFSYAMKQPTYVKATLGSHTIVYDGKAMLITDAEKKTAQRRDLATVDDASKLMMMHQAFSRFTCEGWRPPLLRPSGFSTKHDNTGHWVISVPIDDAVLRAQQLVLKAPSGEFVSKSIVDKAGQTVSSTKVIAESVDPTTHLEVPMAWEQKDSDGNVLKLTVDKAVVNAALNGGATGFATDIPAGYTEVKE